MHRCCPCSVQGMLLFCSLVSRLCAACRVAHANLTIESARVTTDNVRKEVLAFVHRWQECWECCASTRRYSRTCRTCSCLTFDAVLQEYSTITLRIDLKRCGFLSYIYQTMDKVQSKPYSSFHCECSLLGLPFGCYCCKLCFSNNPRSKNYQDWDWRTCWTSTAVDNSILDTGQGLHGRVLPKASMFFLLVLSLEKKLPRMARTYLTRLIVSSNNPRCTYSISDTKFHRT
jgi:hypothetical protein